MIKITILTATYNSGATLEQCVSSIINQTYPNIEFIIIDGKSNDNTSEIVKKYRQYISFYMSEEDNGIYDALNKGINLATGDYIEIIGSDDCLLNYDVIDNVVKRINSDTDIYSGNVLVVNEKYNTEQLYDNKNALNCKEYRGGMIPHAGMFVKRELLEKYKFDTKYKISSDYKFFLQCYFNDNILFQFDNFNIAFFASGGLSSNNELARMEDKMIEDELGMSFKPSRETIRNKIKKHMYKVKFFRYVKDYILLPKHHCTNKICRWCGRYEE